WNASASPRQGLGNRGRVARGPPRQKEDAAPACRATLSLHPGCAAAMVRRLAVISEGLSTGRMRPSSPDGEVAQAHDGSDFGARHDDAVVLLPDAVARRVL